MRLNLQQDCHVNLSAQFSRGYPNLKAVFGGLNVFVCLPTEFGKVFVTRPFPFVMDFKLVSLMVDQVEDLRRRKLKTSIITSGSDLAKPLALSWRDKPVCRQPAVLCT